MSDINIVDKLFDVSISSSYHMAMVLTNQNLSYAVLDTVRGKFVAFRSQDFNEPQGGDLLYQKFEQLTHTEANLSRNYKKLYVAFASQKSTLVPAPMFDPGDKPKLRMLFGHQNENESLLENYLPEIDSYLVFSVPERLIHLAEDNLDSPSFYHQASPFLEHALLSAKSGEQKVFIAVYPGFLDAAIIHESELKLYNSFPYQSIKDLVFYILYLYDQFQLSSEHTPVELSGQVEENGELHSLLQNYLRDIRFQEFNRSFSYSIGFNDLVQYHHANLINLLGCE